MYLVYFILKSKMINQELMELIHLIVKNIVYCNFYLFEMMILGDSNFFQEFTNYFQVRQ